MALFSKSEPILGVYEPPNSWGAKREKRDIMAKDYGPFPAGLRQGREEGRREILEQVQDILRYAPLRELPPMLQEFIKDNTPPKGGK